MWISKLVLLTLAVHVPAHFCSVTSEFEDQLEVERTQQRQLQENPAFLRSSSLGPLRIHLHYLDMSAFDPAVETHLKEVILPGAVNWYSNVLSVYNLKENWKLKQTMCNSVSVPYSHQTTGLVGVDVVIYVSATNDISDWTAGSNYCALDGSSHRNPIAGTIEYNAFSYTDWNLEDEISANRHLIAHVLAFSKYLYPLFTKPDGSPHGDLITTASLRGLNVTMLSTPKVVEMARTVFECDSLTGVELEGEELQPASHFETRVMFDDFMTLYLGGIGHSIYSAVSLAVFEDSGWYSVNYDYADPVFFAKGCEFFSQKCVIDDVAQFDLFCTEADIDICIFQHTVKGYCGATQYDDDLPAAFQYFSNPTIGGADELMDYCPYAMPYSDGDCTGRYHLPTFMSESYGERICETCQCLTGTYILTNWQQDQNLVHTGCHDVKCADGVATVFIGSAAVVCPAAGGKVADIPSYSGYLLCPTYEELCGPKVCPNACFGYGKCVNGVCVCDQQHSGSDCSVDCDGICKTCAPTSSSYCFSCHDNALLVNGSCKCIDGYPFNPTTKQCILQCHASCQDCEGPESNQCTSCGVNAKLESSGKCSCNPGFTRSEDKSQCVLCDVNCITCQGTSSDQCTACKPHFSLPVGELIGPCDIDPGFFQPSSSSPVIPCHASCKECISNTATSCTACYTPSTQLFQGKCVCSDGYYLSADLIHCSACSLECSRCKIFGSAMCMSCYPNAFLTPEGGPGVCSCSAGLFYTTPDGCVSCHFSCSTCSGPYNTQCLTCKNGTAVVGGECRCNSNQFMTLLGTCESCSVDCLTCIDSSTNCTSCDVAVAQLSPDNTCACLSFAYLNVESGKCTACHPTCTTCSGSASDSCSSCEPNAELNSGACVCHAAFFRSADLRQCLACHLSCSSCSGDLPKNCLSCYPSASLSNGTCVCKDGFFVKQDETCGSCDPHCASCSGPNSNTCLTCKVMVAVLSEGSCKCKIHQYLSEDGTECIECHAACKTCAGPGQAGCLSCYNLGFLTPASGPGECSCEAGLYYSAPDGCLGCHATCNKCVGVLASQCIACYTGAALTKASPSTCGCVDGYILSSTGKCLPCDPNCKTCSGKSTKCTSCDPAVSTLYSDSCVCLSRAFLGPSGTCLVCHSSCLTCSTASKAGCQKCSSSAVLTSSPGLCLCASGFFPTPGSSECTPCHPSCKECSDSLGNTCTQCFSPAILSSFGACECPAGYFPSPHASSCKPCDPTCRMCTNALPSSCLACFAQAKLTDTVPDACVCISGTMPRPTTANCGDPECDLTCRTCEGSQAEQCSSCMPKAVGQNAAFPTSCQCAPGFYPKPNSANCSACHVSCLTCKGASPYACLSCAASKVMVANLFCDATCPTGQEAANGVCALTSISTLFRLQAVNNSPVINPNSAAVQVQLGYSPNLDVSDPKPFYQQGWLFDGNDDYMLVLPETADKYLLLDSTHSIEAWLRPALSSEFGCIISKYSTVSQHANLNFRLCVTDTMKLLLEISLADLRDANVRLTKTLVGGEIPASRTWTSVAYQVVLKSKSSSTVSIFVNQVSVASETFPGLIFRDYSGKSDVEKLIVGAALQAYEEFDYHFKGNIAEVSMYNSEVQAYSSSCGCDSCSAGGLCLTLCFANEYQASSSSCGPCLASCTAGCLRSSDCLLNIDPLCAAFASFSGCTRCKEKAQLTSAQCQCVTNANFVLGENVCRCVTDYEWSGLQCVKCRTYFKATEVTARFDSSFLKLLIAFENPVATLSTCDQLFASQTLEKLGSGYSCSWSADSKLVEVLLGAKARLGKEKVSLNYENLYAAHGDCGYSAVPLEPVATYTAPLPLVTAKLNAPQTFSIACSASETLNLDASATIGGRSRDLTFSWTIVAVPTLDAVSQYTNFKTSSPTLSIPKTALGTSQLTVRLTVSNFFGSTDSVSKTVKVISDAAVTLEVEGGSAIAMQASVKRVIKVSPKAVCSKGESLQYTWSFLECSPALPEASFPFLASPSPPNTITIPPNVLLPGYNYTFQVAATNSHESGTASFQVSVVWSPLAVVLDKTDCEVGAGSSFRVSGAKSRDTVNSQEALSFAWSCSEGATPCTDSKGQLVVSSESNDVLIIPPEKLKENSTWNITLTISKDTRKASKAILIRITAQSVAEFTLLEPLSPRVDSSKPLRLAYQVISAAETSLKWSQIAGGSFQALTPLSLSYFLIAGQSMQNGVTYGFSLVATNTYGQASTQVTFYTNSPPRSGTVMISPLSGIALSTEFQQVSSNWEDAEEDYPLSYRVDFVSGSQRTPVSRRSLSPEKTFKTFSGTHSLAVSVFDSMDSFTTADPLVITVTTPSRLLQSVTVLQAFRSDIVDIDRIYEMVIAYSRTFTWDNSTYAGIFSAWQDYSQQLLDVDSTDVDLLCSCVEAFFQQKMTPSSLPTLARVLEQAAQKRPLTQGQLTYLSGVLARYPGTSADERSTLEAFFATMIKMSVADVMPGQDPLTYSSRFMTFFYQRISGEKLAGMHLSAGSTSFVFPPDFASALNRTSTDVMNIWFSTVNYTTNSSDTAAIRLYTSGSISEYASTLEPPTELRVSNLQTPVSFSMTIHAFDPNITYECVYQASNGSWTSEGMQLKAVAASSANCTTSHLSVFSVRPATIPEVPLPPPYNETDSCSTNFAPIAIVSAQLLLSMILSALLLVQKGASDADQSSGHTTNHSPNEGDRTQMVNIKNQMRCNTDLANDNNEIIDDKKDTEAIKVTEKNIYIFMRAFREWHSFAGLVFNSSITRRLMNTLRLNTAVAAAMAITGIRYDSAQDSHSIWAIWSGYDISDFVNALIGLAVGFGISLLLLVLLTLAGKSAVAIRLCGLLALVVTLLATGGVIYQDLDMCFEAGGRWAINFPVILLWEVVINETILSAGRAVVVTLVKKPS